MRVKPGYCIFPLVGVIILTGCATGAKFTAGSYNFAEEDAGVSLDEAELLPVANLVSGEKLVYEVSWIGIPVGQIILENQGLEEIDGREAYHLTFLTVSNDFLSNFFHIEDTVHTWISREGGVPLRFEKVIKEGHYDKHEVIKYDREVMTATYDRRDKDDYTPHVMKMPTGSQDVFSMVYWLRRQPIKMGDLLTLDVNADKKNWKVDVEVIDQGVVETEFRGKSKAYVLEPTATHKGDRLQKGQLQVWITADRRKIPLVFEADTSIFGKARAILTEAVLPPLPEDYAPEAGEEEKSLLAVFASDSWVNGLTQAVTCCPGTI